MSEKQDTKELEKLFLKMSKEQLRQYFTLLVLMNIPFSSNDFWKLSDKEDIKYLNPFIYSIFIAVLLNSGNYRALNRDRALDRALDLYRTLNLYRAIARAIALDLALDRAFDRAFDRVLDLDLACDLALDHDLYLVIELAKFLLEGSDFNCIFAQIQGEENVYKFPKLAEYFKELPNKCEGFLRALHKGENPRISVWADLFEKMLKNNLKLEPNEIEALLKLTEKDINLTVAESSEILYSYLYGGSSDKYEMRLIILGEKGHGKTAFRCRFVDLNGKFPEPENTTEGVDFEAYKIPNSEKEVTINFWDFAGDTVTHEAHKYFLTERAVYVIVCGTRGEERTISKWLEHIKDFADISGGRKPKVFILVNLFSDSENENVKIDINENQFKQNYMNDFELDFNYMNLKFDNKSGGKIEEFRTKIENYILELDTNVPGEYVKINEKIQETKNDGYITVSKTKEIIETIMGEYSVAILKALHRFAIFFYYDDKNLTDNNNRVILKPEWITYAVYKIIRYAHKKNGIIRETQLEIALAKNGEDTNKFEYKREAIPWIGRTLVHFQIAYKRGDKFVFPMCLKMQYENEKTTLEFDEKNSFMVNFTPIATGTSMQEQLPQDIVSSIIINNHENLVYEDGFMLATRTYARFKTKNAVAEIYRANDYRLYIIGQGEKFEDYTEIVVEYAEKLQKHLNENCSRFKRKMPEITVKYGNEDNVPIREIYQIIIDKIQKGFSTEKDLIVLTEAERLKRMEGKLDTLVTGQNEIKSLLSIQNLALLSELQKQFDILKNVMKNQQQQNDILESMEDCFDNFLSALKENNKEKTKSKLLRFGKFARNVIANKAISTAFFTALGNTTQLLPDIVQEFLKFL